MDKKNIVVYKNEFNDVPLKGFNSNEMDLLFSIISQMKNKGTTKKTFTFDELHNLSKYKRDYKKEFIKDVESVYDKLIKLNIRIENDEEIIKFVLFTSYYIDKVNETITIAVNKEFAYILNDIMNNFTKFELEEFLQVRSTYSKTMYRLLKQYRKTGYKIYSIDEFKRLLDIPNTYRMCNISTRVLKPIERELPKFFKNLTITKLANSKGREITHIEFKFDVDDVEYVNTYRDNAGFYYSKNLIEINEKEYIKTFPQSPLDINK